MHIAAIQRIARYGSSALMMLTCFAGHAASVPPYPASRVLTVKEWDFGETERLRKAPGSDIWRCTWAIDDAIYCAWGDGGGFEGDDHIGRTSLGFARITGKPTSQAPGAFSGENVWGTPPYARAPAWFGGKVASLISIDGTLYGIGALWTAQDSSNPVSSSGAGPHNKMIWSKDLGRTWEMADWSSPNDIGRFLNFGRDNLGARDGYVYIYYLRENDEQRLYLKRVPKDQLTANPADTADLQYFAGSRGYARRTLWSSEEADAAPVFLDKNHVFPPDVVYAEPLHRYLLIVGHSRTGHDADSPTATIGIFESTRPWGPWKTVGYYDAWGGYSGASMGEFLGVHFPTKWISSDGTSLWGVFSALNEFDSFNLVQLKLKIRGDLTKGGR